MEADIITISDRPAGLVGSVLRGLGAMSLAVAFLAGIIFATWVAGESEVARPPVSPAVRTVSALPPRPAQSEAFAVYLVSSNEQKATVEAAFEKLRQEPGLRGFGASVFYIAEDGGQVTQDRALEDLLSFRDQTGMPEVAVVDLRPSASR